MEISLGETLKLAKAYEGKQAILLRQLNQVSTMTYATGEEPLKPAITVEETLEALTIAQERSRLLRMRVSVSNQTTDTELGISLGEALLTLKQLLQSRSYLETLANNQPLSRVPNMYGRSQGPEYVQITYDLDMAKAKYQEIESSIRLLRRAIDKVNVTKMIDVPDEYLEV